MRKPFNTEDTKAREEAKTKPLAPSVASVFKFVLLPLLLLAAGSQQLAAQSFTTITAANIQSRIDGTKLARGQACFLPTDQNDNPIVVNDASGGLVSDVTPACGAVSSGAIAAGFQVANSATTNPSGIYYRIQVIDSCSACATKGQVVLDLRKVPNVAGASWSLDAYVPTVVTIPPAGGSVAGPLAVTGANSYFDIGEIAAPGVPASGKERWYADLGTHLFTCLTSAGGNCNPAGGGAGYSVIEQAGAGLAQRLTLNFVSGVTCVDNPGASRTDCTAAGGGGGSGTVISVGLTLPAWLSVAGSPVTTSGTLAVTATGAETANQVLATPDGVSGAVGLRALVANDIPALAESKITSLTTDLAAKLAAASNLSDVANAATARTNLGLGTAATHAQTDFSGVGSCAASNWVHAVNGNAAPTCTQPAYSDLSGTPTLEYQTVQQAGVSQTQRGKLNFTSGMTCSDNPGAGSTDCSPFSAGILCSPGLNGGLTALAAGTYTLTSCRNASGATETITGIRCFTDNNGTSTLNATLHSGAGLLTSAFTCNNAFAAGTQSATTTIAAGDWITFTLVSDGATTRFATQVVGQ